jgi:hypothetical protein
VRLFYLCPKHHSCYGLSQRMQAFYAIVAAFGVKTKARVFTVIRTSLNLCTRIGQKLVYMMYNFVTNEPSRITIGGHKLQEDCDVETIVTR